MPPSPPNLAPPFVIARAGHVVLTAAELGENRASHADMPGLSVSDHDSDALDLRGLEGATYYHSLLIRRSDDAPACARLGFRVPAEDGPPMVSRQGAGKRAQWDQPPRCPAERATP